MENVGADIIRPWDGKPVPYEGMDGAVCGSSWATTPTVGNAFMRSTERMNPFPTGKPLRRLRPSQ